MHSGIEAMGWAGPDEAPAGGGGPGGWLPGFWEKVAAHPIQDRCDPLWVTFPLSFLSTSRIAHRVRRASHLMGNVIKIM
jgi:hypothetical protein